ncbi:transposase [Serpentinicella alkaliphila]|uniref:DDE family transposase n=1 Tax=Serpentinicella alkaliphila TaxID=1734049 RepID=A0A4R2TBR3_9FIRM|nr:transposase [Serpentinicella alkaliphila]TCP98414.1 DDE family transposase [Serpentinicella alkaliphila]
MIYQILAGYFNDNDADELSNEPVFKSILDKECLDSQPTLSRFFNRMDSDTLTQFNEISKELRKIAYMIKKPEKVLFDLDSTLLNTFGVQ